MTGLQALVIALILAPALGIVLWPLLRRGDESRAESRHPEDRRLELQEEKATVYRALKELAFDHETGHITQDDYQDIRARYEARAAELLSELDALGPRPAERVPSGPPAIPSARGWAWHPVTLAGGGLAVLAFGVVLGLGVSRYTEPEPTSTPGPIGPGAALPGATGRAPMPPAMVAGQPTGGEPQRALPPEMLAGMLQAARQSLIGGRYQEAIAAYQAVLKRDPRNVDAMTHLGLIVAIGGHADAALEAFDKALSIDPRYAPAYLYQGQVLYEVKQDYPGAVKAWEQFIAIAPSKEERDRVAALLQDARAKQR